MVWSRVILQHILEEWASACLACTPGERYKPECSTPTAMPWGTFSWHGLGPLIPWEGRFTAKQYSFILWWNLYILMRVVLSRMMMPPSAGHDGSLDVWVLTRCESYAVCYGLCSHQSSTQLNNCGIFWTNVVEGALHHNHQNGKWGHLFSKNGLSLP